ncbi:hypothetical protein diail_249 [Diaporthe ilicicola]|nr:hypothetical protein diail_249 [Diaporthe ilicicola]
MASSQTRTLDKALNGSAPATSTGVSGSGAAYSPRLHGVGAQFASNPSGLSGEQRTAHDGKK